MTVKRDQRQSAPAGARRNGMPGVVVVAGICIVVFGAMFWFLRGLLDEPAKPVEQVVQVQVFRPPPPPPPPDEPPPPPPEQEEEVDIPQPEPLEALPDVAAPESTDRLGLDAEGVAGGDAFGLLANRGGTGLVGAGRNRWYAQRVKDQVDEALARDEALRSRSFRIRVLIWVDPSGRLESFRVTEGSGDPDLDRQLEESLRRMGRLAEAPPAGFPQPVALRIEGRV